MCRVLRIAVYAVILSSLFFVSGNAYAFSASLNGNLINGWYKGMPTFQVAEDKVNCGSGTEEGNGPISSILREGVHTYTFREASNNALYSQIDGGRLYVLNDCIGNDPSVAASVWSETIKIDTSAPSLSVSTPSNNSNTTNSTIIVSGIVTDADSGVSSVRVNGSLATLSGNSFKVFIPLTLGLNTINVIATDNVGYTTTAPSITVLRMNQGSSVNTKGQSSGTNGGPSSNGGSNQQSQLAGKSNPGKNKTAIDSSGSQNAANHISQKSTQSQNKIAVGVGFVSVVVLVIASFMGYVPYKKFGLITMRLVAKIIK